LVDVVFVDAAGRDEQGAGPPNSFIPIDDSRRENDGGRGKKFSKLNR
jgi:hypothetical protein